MESSSDPKPKEEEEEPTPTVSGQKEGWETPIQEPNNGIVQPRYIPPSGKPTKHTNCLEFISNQVLKPALKHKHAWPFAKPVDTIKLNIPEYHKVIKKPMDLGTIEKRLKNVYYTGAEECIKDIMTVFTNCYAFNPPEFGVCKMAKDLEGVILSKLNKMPAEEVEIDKNPTKKSSKFGSKKSNVGNGPLARAGSTTSAVGKGSVESSPSNSAPSESAAAVLDFFHNATLQVSRESSIQRNDSAGGDRAISIEKKPIKRKLDTPPPPIIEEKRRATIDASRAKRPPDIDYNQLAPRLHGKPNKQMSFCQKTLKEISTSTRCKTFNWPFLEPVDAEALNIPDYYNVIKNPMDLSTMQKKMNAKQYATPDEFYADLMLICNNCFLFNPDGQPVNIAGKQMKEFFLQRWKEMPPEEVAPPTPKPTTVKQNDPYAFSTNPPQLSIPSAAAQPSTVSASVSQNFGDLNDDDELDSLMFYVQSENQRMATRLTEFSQFNSDLLKLKMDRREAKQTGKYVPPLKSDYHTKIRNSLLSGLLPTVSAQTSGFTVSTANRTSAFTNGSSASSSSYQQSKLNRGRKPGTKNRPKTSQRDDKSEYDFNTDEETTDEPYSQTAANDSQISSSQPNKSGRGRKPGSKNKPKLPQPSADEDRDYEFNSEDEHSTEPMTYGEKKDLSHNINQLSSTKLPLVLEIISKREGNPNNQQLEEVEIDFETLKPKTLRELEAFVNACNNKANRKPNAAQKAVDPMAKKREIEERLAVLNGSQPTAKSTAPVAPSVPLAPQKPAPGQSRPQERANSPDSSSSSSGSSGSSSDSSSESDSDSEKKDQWSSAPVKKVSPKPATDNGNGEERRRVAHTNNNTIGTKPGANAAKSGDKTSQSNKAPALPSNGGGNSVGTSVLDQLLPSATSQEPTSLSTNISKNIHSTFDAFRKMKTQKDQTQQNLREQENRRKQEEGGLLPPPMAPDLSQASKSTSQDEIKRLKELDRQRRQREAQSTNAPSQLELMSLFEEQF